MNNGSLRVLIARVLFVLSVCALSACGGGSMGTGISAPRPPLTLRDKAIEKSTTPRVPTWLRPSAGACLGRAGSSEVPIEVETELGAVAPLAVRAQWCSFALPAQAQLVTIRSMWMMEGETVVYRVEQVACTGNRREVLRQRNSTVRLHAIELPQLSIARGHFLLITLQHARGDDLKLVLSADRPDGSCTFTKE